MCMQAGTSLHSCVLQRQAVCAYASWNFFTWILPSLSVDQMVKQAGVDTHVNLDA